MIKNIIFDVGNVLAAFGWRECLESFHFPKEIEGELAEAVFLNPVWAERDRGVWTDEEIFQGFLEKAPERGAEIQLLIDNIQTWIREYPYAEELVKSLKEAGYHTYYLSNYGRDFETAKKTYGFFTYMDGGVVSWEEHVIKPDAKIFEILLERYDLKAEECVFLDDSTANVEAAEALGFTGIVVNGEASIMEGLQRLGVCPCQSSISSSFFLNSFVTSKNA